MFKKLLTLAAPLILASSGLAQTAAESYDLHKVLLDGGPFTTPQFLTGSFTWTYQVGDFENGAGVFTSLDVPWTGETLATLNTNIDVGSIEIVLPGSFHDKGVDISLKLVHKLGPGVPAAIDFATSKFEIQDGPIHSGPVVSGEIAPPNTIPASYGAGTAGTGGFIPTIADNGSFAHLGSLTFGIEAANLVGGASAFTLIGFAQTSTSTLGFDLLVSPAGLLMIPATASGAPGVAGAGSYSAAFPVPASPVLVGLQLDLQVAAIDTGATSGLVASSAGLTTTIFP